MNTQEYVKSLFKDYEETGSLKDFMEELQSNLDARIASLLRKGLPEDEAFTRACAELGDISTIADDLSRKKKQEVYSEMYMGTRRYLTPKRTALFILGGAIVCFGLTTGAITWFATEIRYAALASGMLFIALGAAFLTFMGLTQETAANNPMSWKRAFLYAVSVMVFLFGVLSVPISYFAISGAGPSGLAGQDWTLPPMNLAFTSAIASAMTFILPGAALFIFLALTEKDRSKAWAAALREKAKRDGQELFANTNESMRFGLYSGAIWIAALALCILLGFIVSFKISWIVFLFAIAVQLFVQGAMMKNKGEKKSYEK